jgi:O-antigen/teichoic acid export membrane protein
MSLGGFIVNLTGLIILVPLYGYIGAAVSIFISFLTITVVSYILGQKYYPVNYPVLKILFLILSGIGLYFIDKNLSIDSVYVRYLIKGSIFVLYIGSFYAMERLTISGKTNG